MFDDYKREDDLPTQEDEGRDDREEDGDSEEESEGETPPADTDEQVSEGDEDSEGEPDAADDEAEGAEGEGEAEEQPSEDADGSEGERDEGEDSKGESDAADEEAEGAEGEGEAEGAEEEKEEEKGPTPGTFDGLDSGLAWCGEPAYEPPLPTGYLPPPEAEGPAAAVSAADRSQRIKERLASRRAETEAERTWIQKVPIPVWLCMPATIFIIVWIALFARPWAQIPEPGEDMKVDSSILKASSVDDVVGRMMELRIKDWDPEPSWQILANDVLGLKSRKSRARLVFYPPERKNFTVSCQVCIIDTLADHSVWLRIHESRAVGLESSEREDANPGAAFYKSDATGTKTLKVLQPTPVKTDYWYTLAIRVKDGVCTYFVNGKELSEKPNAPATIEAISVVAKNVRFYVRNWTVGPAE
jgi:hypothetical protein